MDVDWETFAKRYSAKGQLGYSLLQELNDAMELLKSTLRSLRSPLTFCASTLI